MSKSFIITIATLLIIGAVAGLGILLAKGYIFSPQEGKVTMIGTGIITATSVPDGASVYIDGHLTSATNTTISQLAPKTYSVKIAKDGFIPWEKNIEVKKGLVSEVKATLFPSIPTIYPLTFNGVINPVLSPDGQKLVFTVPFVNDSSSRQKGGIWVWTMSSQPISFAKSAEPHQIAISDSNLDFTKTSLRWSPDSKQILATLYEGNNQTDTYLRNYLLSADQLTRADGLRDITPTVSASIKGWEEDQSVKDEARIAIIKDFQVRKVASDSASLTWSPDETKFISGRVDEAGKVQSPRLSSTISGQKNITPTAEPMLTGYKVYDLETSKEYSLPEAKSYQWLPDSRHIILIQEGKIALCEFDGTNIAVIFAGTFEDSLVFAWPDASRLVMVSSFNTPTASKPNLFGINLK